MPHALWTRRQSRLAAAVAMGLATASLGMPAAAQEFNTAGTVVYFDAAGNENLDPADPQAASSFSREVMLTVYDPLIRLADNGDPAPGLAESWSVGNGLATLTLKLPAGLKDDAGRTLTNAAKFPLGVKTDLAPPLAKFAAGFGLIVCPRMILHIASMGLFTRGWFYLVPFVWEDCKFINVSRAINCDRSKFGK